MNSPVAACNMALDKLGADSITSITDPETDLEIRCQRWFKPVQRAVLESVAWTFAIKRAVLTQTTAEPPPWGYDYALVAPGDMLRVVDCRADDKENAFNMDEWRFENGLMLINVKQVYVRYIYLVEDLNLWSELAIQALATRLAYEMCIGVTENRSLKADLVTEYLNFMAEAKVTDGMQGKAAKFRTGRLKGVRNVATRN